jgi:hypothetical protein
MSIGDDEPSYGRGGGRVALPSTECVQPAASMAAEHQTNNGLVRVGMALTPFPVDTLAGRIQYGC